tara:strand:- start:156 stop:368 length:213 start_codon:yes stop_codon:yes gene_type:complete
MTNIEKFWSALSTIKSGVECTVRGDITTEDEFDNIEWNTGVDSNGIATTTTTCPHSEITWTKVKAEMDKL